MVDREFLLRLAANRRTRIGANGFTFDLTSAECEASSRAAMRLAGGVAMSLSANFQALSRACDQRGYCLELHDDGKTRKIKDGVEYRVINALRITRRKTHTQVLHMLCSLDTLDQVAATALQRLR